MSNKKAIPKHKNVVHKRPLQNKVAPENKSPVSYRKLWEILAILVLVFITYGNAIKNDYNIDDGFIVSLDRSNILTEKGISGIPEILKSTYNEGEGVTYGYRPLAKVTMAIEYSLWQNNPQYSHFINLLLYALNVFLLLVFIKKIATLFNYKNLQLIYIAVLLFIIHPIHTEVVCSIKNREEILCFTFMLAALLVFFKFIEEKKWWYLLPFSLLTFLAFLSKETAFNIFGILLLISFFNLFVNNQEKPKIKDFLKKVIKSKYTLVIIVALVCFNLFDNIVSSLPVADIGFHFEQIPYRFSPGIHSIPNGLQTIFFYIKRLLVPFPLLFYYGYDMLPLQYWISLNTLIGIIVFLFIAFFIINSIKNKKDLFLIFWILFFFGTVFPFSNLLYPFNITGIVGERLIYQASSGFCLILAWIIFRITSLIKKNVNTINQVNNKLTYYLSLLVILPFLFLTINRNTQWLNKKTLYEHDIKYLTKSARSNFILSSFYMKEFGKESDYSNEKPLLLNKAKNYLFQALKIYPDFDDAWVNLGIINFKYLSQRDSAVYALEKVNNSSIYTFSRAQELLGDIYYVDFKDSNKSLNYYLKGFNLTPKNKTLYKKITQIYFEKSEYDTLIVFTEKAILNNWVEGFIDKGDAYLNKKDTSSAVKNYKTAVEKGYNTPLLIDIEAYQKRKK